MTPVLRPEAVLDIMKMSFDSDSASGETDNIRVTDVVSDYSFFWLLISGRPFLFSIGKCMTHL